MSSALFHRHNLIYYDLGPKYTVWNIKCSFCFYKSTRLTSVYKPVFVKHTDFKYLFNINSFLTVHNSQMELCVNIIF
jgi:hypothetical protein